MPRKERGERLSLLFLAVNRIIAGRKREVTILSLFALLIYAEEEEDIIKWTIYDDDEELKMAE